MRLLPGLPGSLQLFTYSFIALQDLALQMFFHRVVPEQEWSVVPGKQISLSFHPEELARGEGQKKI